MTIRFGRPPDDEWDEWHQKDSDDEEGPKRAVTRVGDDDDDDEAQEHEPNYECVVCGAEQYIEDEHQSTAPAWCGDCETVRDHWNIEKHE